MTTFRISRTSLSQRFGEKAKRPCEEATLRSCVCEDHHSAKFLGVLNKWFTKGRNHRTISNVPGYLREAEIMARDIDDEDWFLDLTMDELLAFVDKYQTVVIERSNQYIDGVRIMGIEIYDGWRE